MQNKEDIEALAARVEAATGADREMDEVLLLAIGGKKRSSDWWLGFAYIGRNVPAYTASLDAAMTLVPEGCLFHVRTLWDGPIVWGYAHVHTYGEDVEECDGKRHLDDYIGSAATLALALTAAALRAIAKDLTA